ncbi:MAG: M24 family metallopeptidase, partial [Thermoguttaceae bacterium]
MSTPILIAGIPELNATLYWQIRFLVGDPAALIIFPNSQGNQGAKSERLLILRDIEMERARQAARADRVACPADFKPTSGLSGDRETATAQATAECLRQRGVSKVVADRTLPLIFVEVIKQSGITVECDFDLGVTGRRQKDEQEINWIREAQKTTESAVRLACEMVANADVAADGTLKVDGETLTAESVKFAINTYLLKLGYGLVPWIVAGGKSGGDCHDHGT